MGVSGIITVKLVIVSHDIFQNSTIRDEKSRDDVQRDEKRAAEDYLCSSESLGNRIRMKKVEEFDRALSMKSIWW